MSKIILSLALVTIMSVFSYANTPVNAVDFYKGSLEEAKKKALDDGKLFFVDFYASWCAPCKWMDETTFQDSRVATMLNDNFVSLKVDIDQFDGFSLKQQYKIKYLPTILIFSADGQLIDRIEETMSPSKLLNVLNTHHAGNSAKPKVKQINTSPSKSSKPSEIATDNVEETNKMPEDNFESPFKDKYRVQVGIYSDFKNTFHHVNELKQQFAEPIIVLNDYNNGKIVYRVMMGEFKSSGEATSFVKILKEEFGISGIVK